MIRAIFTPSDLQAHHSNALTIALAGCGGPGCLRGSPPKLCRTCEHLVTVELSKAACAASKRHHVKRSNQKPDP